MCDTMANIPPLEDNSSYVLTQDMIDAAMTQHLSYQNDFESEEDSSSLDENIDLEKNKGCANSGNVINSSNETGGDEKQSNSTENIIITSKSPTRENTSSSVLVIETGLDKTINTGEENTATTAIAIETGERASHEINIANSSLSQTSNIEGNHLLSNGSSTSQDISPVNKDTSSKSRLQILKKMLTEPPNIESIDLCDSDVESSENEVTEIETIDNELKSVMENNLMAEVGMRVDKSKVSNSVQPVDTPPKHSAPRIKVKNVTQLSPNTFNAMPQSSEVPDTCTNRTVTNSVNSLPVSNAVINKDLVPNSIHINKIAVPHHTVVNQQGQKMRCVYVKSPSGAPFVINSSQNPTRLGTAGNQPVRLIMTQQLKKPVVRMSPLEALSNVTTRHLQFNQPTPPKQFNQPTPPKQFNQPTPPKPKKITPAPRPKLKTFPPASETMTRPVIDRQQEMTSHQVIKTLLFQRVMPPYTPPDMSPDNPTFDCADCGDRFIIQSSLTQHLARRSVIIRYWCRNCGIELNFYNRCVFFRHLRNHNQSTSNLAYSNITMSSLPKEMISNGLISSVFKENISNLSLPIDECILPKGGKNMKETSESSKKSSTSVCFDKPPSAIGKFNPSKQTVSMVNSQPKAPVHLQNQQQTLLLKSTAVNSSLSNSQPKKSLIPPTAANVPMVSLLHNVQPQTTNILTETTNPSPPKSNILFVNKYNKSTLTKQSTITTSIPPNEMFALSESMIIDDDDTEEQSNRKSIEDEEIDIESIIIDDESPTEKNSPISGAEIENNSNPKMKRKPSSSDFPKPSKRMCSECGQSCLNINRHLNGSNRPSNPELACKSCYLIMPTRCSLKIHSRTHTKTFPYKCPDCGKDFVKWQELHSHLKFSCGHLAKCVRYMCTNCKSHFPSRSVLGHHISTQHSRDIFRCSLCPVAFYNKISLNKHITTTHQNQTAVGINQKQCSLCPKKLVPLDDFLSHVEQHTKNNNNLIYGYKCPMCSVVFANKMAFIIHQIKEKKEMEEKNEVQAKLPTQSQSQLSTSDDTDNNNIVQEIAQADTSSQFEEETECVARFPETGDSTVEVEKDPLSLDGWEESQEQRVKEKREELCIVCKINSVYILPGIDLNNQSLCCKQCVKPLDVDSAVVNSKAQVGHNQVYFTGPSTSKTYACNSLRTYTNERPKPVNKRRISDTSLLDSSSKVERRFETAGEFGNIKNKSRKKQSKDQFDSFSQAHIQGQVISSKSSGELVCSKCKFVADRKETFIEHITTHRSDPNTFQCLECGLCFVVLPSLERHLQMNHGIKDAKHYLDKNPFCMPQKSAPMEEEESLEENQCRVCLEIFDSLSSLEKHFRTHGMAFMSTLSKSP